MPANLQKDSSVDNAKDDTSNSQMDAIVIDKKVKSGEGRIQNNRIDSAKARQVGLKQVDQNMILEAQREK